jgi:hypothetical protein
MSAATSFMSMVQQLTNGLGIAFAAIAVHLAHVWRGGAGDTLLPEDFHTAFLTVALLSLGSIYFFWLLPPAAGSDITGHRPSPPAEAALDETAAE